MDRIGSTGGKSEMLVDSVVDPSREKAWCQASLDQDLVFETRWNDWKKWVARHDAVYPIGTTEAEVQAKREQLRATATCPAPPDRRSRGPRSRYEAARACPAS